MAYTTKQTKRSVYFVICPNEGPKMEGVVLNRVGIIGLFCPKQSQGFRPSAAPIHPNKGQVTPPPPPRED